MTGLFTNSGRMQAIKEAIGQVAATGATVLIRGETGVGQDIVARAIHSASPRQNQPFIKVDCKTIPHDRLEPELFGNEGGALLNGDRPKLGRFDCANNGTIFLDEIAELPRPVQAKLLHVLQHLQFSRVGGQEMIRVDVRVIASTRLTRGDLVALTSGVFCEGLSRLNVVEIQIPPLRERKEDIPALASFFLSRFNQRYHRNAVFSPETISLFTEYPWPGNIRELQNVVLRFATGGDPR